MRILFLAWLLVIPSAALAGPPCTVPNGAGSYNFDTCGNPVVNTGAPGSGGTVTTTPPTLNIQSPTGATTIAVINTWQTLFAAASMVNGAFIQNPAGQSNLCVGLAAQTGACSCPANGATGPNIVTIGSGTSPFTTVGKYTGAVSVCSSATESFSAGTN